MIVVMNDTREIAQMKSQVTLIIRGMYSNPPNHGARIVATILNNPELYEEWFVSTFFIIPFNDKKLFNLFPIPKTTRKGHIREMSGRIKNMRSGLFERLVKLGTSGNWEHIVSQIGMFSYTGLNGNCIRLEGYLYLPCLKSVTCL